MIGFTLTEEQHLLQRTARDFARTSMAPALRAVRGQTGADRWAMVEPVFRKGAALGFPRMMLPEAAGGLGHSAIDLCVVMEELAAGGDVAMAADLFNLTATVPLVLHRGGTAEQHARLLPPLVSDRGFLVAGAQSEPDVGGAELMYMGEDARLGPRTLAQPVDGGYVLRGRKSAFVTNAGQAEGFLIMARTALDRPVSQTLTMFWVERDTPGLTVGPSTKLIGWKTSGHAPLFLDDVFVPERNRIGAEGGAGMLFAQVPEMAVGLAACFVGLARATYDYALAYARERVSHGRPIIEHQTVGLKLADMAVDLQAARLLAWDAAAACATDPMQAATVKAPAAKTQAVQAAIRNAERCVQIMGGYGVTEEYEAGRMLVDAWIGYACDFTGDVLRLGMVPFLQ